MKIPCFALYAALAGTVLFTQPSLTDGQSVGHIGPSNGAIIGGAVGIGAGIAAIAITVAVVHSHHFLNGCFVTGTNGPELKTADAKTWSLEGDSANLKPGDRVKVHGARVNHHKTSSGADVFKVDKLVRDYGPCEVSRADASGPAH